MRIQSLEIQRLRNLRAVRVDLDPGINYFFGDNGAGKTAVLESVALLARGRSFRSGQPADLISFGESAYLVRASLLDETRGEQTVGLTRDRSGRVEIRINGEPGKRLSEMVRLLPVQIVLPSLGDLVFGSPAERRQWLDWGLFHVKPSYLDALREYLRLLRQRNAGLKSLSLGRLSEDALGVWTARLANQAEVVHGWRADYVEAVVTEVNAALADLSPKLEVRFDYRRGWSQDDTLAKVLSESLSRDVKSGTTSAGPHRSDVDIKVVADSVSARAATVLSRGQGKIVASAMVLGQATHLAKVAQRSSVFLIDDLGAELDTDHGRRLLLALHRMGCQVLATSTQSPDATELGSKVPVRGFHVKHGGVIRLGAEHPRASS